MAEPLFDEGFQGCPLLVRQLAGLCKETVWYLYGCLHMASHITLYGKTLTIKKTADFILPAERIAVFDNDGALWAEQPLYFQFLFAIDRVKTLALIGMINRAR
jgi:hypothetical protein